eukprot:15475533-Alexandrium_andersonii.AAC.1
MRTPWAAKTAPPIVCKADLGRERPVDCCSGTTFSTTLTGSFTTTAGSISAAVRRISWLAEDCGSSMTSGGGPTGPGARPGP